MPLSIFQKSRLIFSLVSSEKILKDAQQQLEQEVEDSRKFNL